MNPKTVNNKIMIVNADGLVLGASAACANLLEKDVQQLTNVYFLDLGFSLTLTQFLAYFEKTKQDKYFEFKTFFLNREKARISIDINTVYVDSQEAMVLNLYLDESVRLQRAYLDPKHLSGESQPTAIKYSLGEVINVTLLQNIMDSFYELTGMLVAILDMNGNIIV